MYFHSKKEPAALLVAMTLGLCLRARIAFNGSIWADEGSFLNVVAAPSWHAMIAFLRSHESHPPLFYVLMRCWSGVDGATDFALLFAPVLIGVAIIPATYLAGRHLFSPKVGLIAALIAAVAPQLTEHSSQLRPYGLLSLCALCSSTALAGWLSNRSRRAWTIYVVSTTAMLYTHNWAWMIVVGELGAALVLVRGRSPQERRSAIRNAAFMWAVILALYSPWIPSFLFQSNHAGHGALPIENAYEYVGYLLFSIHSILETLILGRLAHKETVAIAAMISTSALLAWTTQRYVRRDDSVRVASQAANALFLFNIGAFALAAALLVSPLNNLILPRGVATVAPMLLLAAGYWIDQVVSRRASRLNAQVTVVVIGFALVAGVFETSALLDRPRSNVGRIAQGIRKSARPDDLLVVAPEWFAASFDHYFPNSIEQIDYPYDGRAAMIDFADVWKTRTQSGSLARIQRRLGVARQSNRRVWFVFERRYTREFSQEQLNKAYRNRQPGIFTVQIVRRIRATLDSLYGPPQRIIEAARPLPINDELLAYLYAR